MPALCLANSLSDQGEIAVDKFFAKAYSLGLDAVAVTHPAPFAESLPALAKLQEQKLYPDFAGQDLQLRTHPQALLPSVKSIISTAIAYKSVPPRVEPQSGLLSRYAWGSDYHRVFTERLTALARWMQAHLSVNEHLICVDTKPTIDRAIFLRAGLGWLGKNCCVYLPDYGSWIFLGSILVDVELPATNATPMASRCGDCELCVKACPTNALFAPGRINPYICISYLTQMQGFIPRQLREKIGIRLWGCDICQEVCPYNQQAKPSPHSCFMPQEGPSVPVIPLLNITSTEFKQRFGRTPIGWRGKGILQRNAAVICGNLRLEEAVTELARAIKDPKPAVRGTAAWALGRIGSKKARGTLAEALTLENDPQVLTEINEALA